MGVGRRGARLSHLCGRAVQRPTIGTGHGRVVVMSEAAAPDRRSRSATLITVCTNCRLPGVERADAPGHLLLAEVEKAALGCDGVSVRPTQCLSVCKRVCTVAISGEGAYTFLFGDIDPAADASAVVEMARACHEAELGFVPWKERPEALRSKIVARVPPPDWSPSDGSAPA